MYIRSEEGVGNSVTMSYMLYAYDPRELIPVMKRLNVNALKNGLLGRFYIRKNWIRFKAG